MRSEVCAPREHLAEVEGREPDHRIGQRIADERRERRTQRRPRIATASTPARIIWMPRNGVNTAKTPVAPTRCDEARMAAASAAGKRSARTGSSSVWARVRAADVQQDSSRWRLDDRCRRPRTSRLALSTCASPSANRAPSIRKRSQSAGRAAAAGGVTTMVMMPHTTPVL